MCIKKYLCFFLCLFCIGINVSHAQNVQVKGTVKEQSGEPIVGASVVVKGDNRKGTIADINGAFSLSVPKGAVLVISILGYKTIEMPAREKMEVVLSSSDVMLEEVVVTGMNKVDKRLFTGASDNLSAENVVLSGIPDISRALEGRSAGVSVQNVSATFGTAPKIRVRGATSILGNSKPLWVVDGVIMEDVTEISNDDLTSGDAVTMISSAVAGLNADDIESFSILKDGSATSIYGAKAMAGVIVITTKKGRPGASRINYTGEFTTRLKPSYSEHNIMNSQEQMSVYMELLNKGFLNLAETSRAQTSGEFGRMYKLINTYNETNGLYGLPNTTSAINNFLSEAEYRNTNWFDELFNNSIIMNHSVSLSTGTEKSSSYISMSVMSDPGWYKKSEVDRYTFNANSSYNILKNLKLTILGNASYRKQKAPGTLGQDANAVYGEIKRDFDINPFSFAMNSSRTMAVDENYTRNYTNFNILQELENNYIQTDKLDAKFQGEINWTIIPGLEVSSLAALSYSTSSLQHHIKDESNQARAYREMSDATIRGKNRYLYTDPDVLNSLPVTILPNGGIYEKREYKARNYTFRNSILWNKIFNNTHIVNLYAGTELTSIQRTNDWFRGWGMQYKEGEIGFFNHLAFKKASEDNASYYSLSNTVKRTVAFFGTLNYSYKGRYNVNGTFRYEGTNRLGRSRSSRWLPTWNFGVAWNVHEEEFFKPVLSTISHLNVKASYSLTADAGPDYITNSTPVVKSYVPWRPHASAKEPGLNISKPGNSELTYEKKHELNVGLSVGLLNNRISVDMDAYKRDNYDLLGSTNTDGTSGSIRQYANIADMESKGFEFTLSTKNIMQKDFKWSTDFTFSWSKVKITNLMSNASVMSLIRGTGYALEGYAPNSLFSIRYSGLDDEGFPTFDFNDSRIRKNNYGSLNFQSTSETVLNSLRYEGPVDPVYTGGFGNIFNYKNFRLNVFITYGFGNYVRLNQVFKSRYSDYDAMPNEFKNRWVKPGDEKQTDTPVIPDVNQLNRYSQSRKGFNAYNFSTARVAKGDFIRMKEISLTYDFPKIWIKKASMSNLSLKLQATNPFLIYAHSSLNGQDPEYVQSGGISSPLAKQFTFTVKVGF